MNKKLHFWLATAIMLLATNLFSQTPATALNFEGPVNNTYDYITVADDPSLDFTNNFTFETWVNFDFVIRNNNGWDWQCLFAKSRFNSSYGLMLLTDTGFQRGLTFYHTGFASNATTYVWPTVASNTWYHIAVTLSATKATIYVDGVEVASSTGTGSLTPNNDPLFIGANDTAGPDPYPLDGTLEETRLWNVTRTQAEIQADMMDQLNGNEAGLVLQFSYNQGNVGEDNTGITTVTDGSTEGNNGTLNQFALTGSFSNFADGSGAGVISRLEQTITFDPLADKTTDDVPFRLTASSDSGLPISYTSSNLAVATISGDMLTIVGEGSTTITASQPGDSTYRPAMEVPQVQLVTLGMTNPCDPGNDNFAPSFTNVDGNTSQTVVLDAMGDISITPESFGITAVDNCTVMPTLSLSQTDFTCMDIGSNTIQLTVTDDQMNSDSIDVTVVVEDNILPVIDISNVPNTPFVLDTMTGEVTITPLDLNLAVTDNCSVSLSLSQTVFTCSDVGNNTITVTATDTSGNTNSGVVTVTVSITENEAPVANCIAPFTVTLDPATSSASITVDQINNGSTDNCTIDTITIDKDTFNCNDLGGNTITLTVTDEAGNQDTCTTIVTIEAPAQIAFPNIGGEGTMVNPFISLAPEEVGGVTSGVYYFNFNGSTFQGVLDNDTDGGGWLMVLNYVHLAGDNSDLTIRNTDLPLLDSSTLPLLPADNEAGTQFWGHMGNALANAIDFDEMRFYGITTGHNRVIDFRTSFANGINYVKTGTGSFANLFRPENHILGANHTATIIPQGAGNVFVNQGNLALTNFPFWASGNAHWGIRGAGARWEVDDSAVNGHSTIHRVWVRNNASSTIESTRLTAQLDATGNVTIAAADFGITAVEGCNATPTQSLSQTMFDCSDIGENTIQLIATTASGSKVIDVTVVVEDTVDPIVSCPSDETVQVNSAGGDYTVPDYFGTRSITITDNCTDPVTVTSQNPVAGSALAVGDHTITLTATDSEGNDGTCTFVVTVEDATLDINDFDPLGKISMYPNPVIEKIYLNNIQNTNLKNYKVFDITGKPILENNLDEEATSIIIDFTGQPSGIYLIKLSNGVNSTIKKIIKN